MHSQSKSQTFCRKWQTNSKLYTEKPSIQNNHVKFLFFLLKFIKLAWLEHAYLNSLSKSLKQRGCHIDSTDIKRIKRVLYERHYANKFSNTDK